MYNNLQNPNKGGRCTFAVSGNSEFQPSAEAQFDAEITQSVKPFKAVPTPNNTSEGAALSYPTMQNDNAAEALRTIIEEMQTPIEQLNNETMNNEQNSAEEEKRKKNLKYRKASTIDSNAELKPDEFLFQWGGIGFSQRQNIASIKSQSGVGKTFALTAFCKAFLTGNNGGLESYAQPHEKILFVDTEQAPNTTLKIVKRLKKDIPNIDDRFKLLNIRNVLPIDRMGYIQFEVEEYKPTLIVIDGIADLIPGMEYNDTTQATTIITELIALAEQNNAVVFTAIHTNKNDDNARGWLGGILNQKADVELMVEKDKTTGQRLLKPTKARDGEFPAISFEICKNEGELAQARIIPLDEAQDIADSKRRQIDRQNIIDLGIFPNQSFTKKALNELIVAAKSKQGITYTDKAAYAQITRWIKSGALKVGDNDYILFEE